MRERQFKVLQSTAYTQIKSRIADGSFRPDTIYSESKLAQELGVSRTPVRDAVHRLFQEGYIDIIPNKGFMLHKMVEKDIIELCEVRSAMEGYCAVKLAEQAKSKEVREILNKLKKALDNQINVLNTTHSAEEFVIYDQDFHELLIAYSDNETFMDIFEKYQALMATLSSYSLKHENRMEETIQEHTAIYNAIKSGNSLEAYNAMLYHMRAPLDINLELI